MPEVYNQQKEIEDMIKEMTYNPEVEALQDQLKAEKERIRREALESIRE